MRFLSSTALGIFIALSLFVLMSVLVSRESGFQKSDDSENMIDFVRVKQDSNLEVRKRSLPKKPPPPKQPPKMEKLKFNDQSQTNNQNIAMNVPKMDIPLGLTGGLYLGKAGGGGLQTGGVVPLVRIEPQYPRKAAIKGLEGWVTLKFDITETGSVANVEVLEAKPKRVFNSAARQALLRWKYKPKLNEGKPERQENNKVKIEFKLAG